MAHSPIEALLEKLFRSDALTKIYGALREQIRSVSEEDVQDAVGHAVIAILKACQPDPPENLASYLFTVAKNHLLRLLRIRSRLQTEDIELDAQPDGSLPPSAEHDFDDLYRWFKRLVAHWDNERMRTVIEILLDAARENVTLTGADIAEQAEALTGEPFSLSSVYEWRRRGLEQLAEDFKRSVERGGQGDRQDVPREH